ncbi:family 16 glycosylhydrolase [Shimia ponticola]|uniref:family 16 glycosylhydrolase n=1 Tax=Shimia ponticola TaxID=2582893 RepID=UPI0011BE95F5|nr:family 16 glycosylhydrolase [Shimia ponticola]
MQKVGMAACATLCTLIGFHVMGGGFEDEFNQIDPQNWHIAHYDFAHPMFDTDWRSGNVGLANGLKLSLHPHHGANCFAGASVRRAEPSHFGWYEATLTAARGSGVITGFFLYTGPHYGTQHDEIDWEFFGHDTTTAQVAWFKDGVLRNKKIQLGFDAAEGPNTYAIHWQAEFIEWYINGRLAYRTTEDIPQTPQMVFANVWAVAPELEPWAGLADPHKSTFAIVQRLSAQTGSAPTGPDS